MSQPFPQTPYDGREPTIADVLRALSGLTEGVNKLDRHITGADEPERGLIVRMDRLEQAQAATRRWMVAAIGSGGGGLAVAIKAWLASGTPHP